MARDQRDCHWFGRMKAWSKLEETKMADSDLRLQSSRGDSNINKLHPNPGEEYENDATVEALWAMKAFEHARIYFNILCSADPKHLKLTPHDNDIHEEFTKHFPDMKLDVLCIDELKSEEAKQKWRPFCNKFEGVVEDFNYGTLLRINAKEEFNEENTILVTRIQFYAIEIARNRSGVNDFVCNWFKSKGGTPVTK